MHVRLHGKTCTTASNACLPSIAAPQACDFHNALQASELVKEASRELKLEQLISDEIQRNDKEIAEHLERPGARGTATLATAIGALLKVRERQREGEEPGGRAPSALSYKGALAKPS